MRLRIAFIVLLALALGSEPFAEPLLSPLAAQDAGGDDDGDDAGDDDAGGDDDAVSGGDDAGGDDDGTAGSDDDNFGTSGGDDDDNSGLGDDDDGDDDDITDDRGDIDDADDAVDQQPMRWEVSVGDTEADRAERDEREGISTDNKGFRYRRSEFVALDLTGEELDELRAGGFEVIESENLETVEGTLLLLRGPVQMTDEAALDVLDTIADPDTVGYNHLFDSSAVQTSRRRASKVPERIACGCDIGLIDTGVATNLNYFKHVRLTQRAFNGREPRPKLHGTAVAHLMAETKGNPERATRIFVADIFSGPRKTSGSSYALIKALD